MSDVDFTDIYYRLAEELQKDIIKTTHIDYKVYRNVAYDSAVPVDQIVYGTKNPEDNFTIIDYFSTCEEDKLGECVTKLTETHKGDKDDNIIVFNLKKYFDEILKSYKYLETKMVDQFLVDLPRTNVYINKTKIASFEQFVDLLQGFSSLQVKFSRKPFSCISMMIMLANQSSYAFPFVFLQKLYQSQDPSNNVMLCCLPSSRNIVYNIDGPNRYVSIEADFGAKDISTMELLMKINVVLTIELNVVSTLNPNGNPVYELRPGCETVFGSNGILKWTTFE